MACAPASADEALDLLDGAGVHAVLMLTPVLRPRHPEAMDVTYFRMPCALKSLANTVSRKQSSCCAAPCADAACSAP